jgi:hypothetical protein
MEIIQYKWKLYNTNRKLYNTNGKYKIQIKKNYTIQMGNYTIQWRIIKNKWKRSNIATFDMPYLTNPFITICLLKTKRMHGKCKYFEFIISNSRY